METLIAKNLGDMGFKIPQGWKNRRIEIYETSEIVFSHNVNAIYQNTSTSLEEFYQSQILVYREHCHDLKLVGPDVIEIGNIQVYRVKTRWLTPFMHTHYIMRDNGQVVMFTGTALQETMEQYEPIFYEIVKNTVHGKKIFIPPNWEIRRLEVVAPGGAGIVFIRETNERSIEEYVHLQIQEYEKNEYDFEYNGPQSIKIGGERNRFTIRS